MGVGADEKFLYLPLNFGGNPNYSKNSILNQMAGLFGFQKDLHNMVSN